MKYRDKTTLSSKDFDALILQTIDEVFSCLGDSPKTAIYFALEKDYSISKEDIPHCLEDFLVALEKLLGLGAKHLEIMFMKHLHKKSQKWSVLERVDPDLTFQAYVKLKRQSIVFPAENCEIETLMEETEQNKVCT